MFSRVMPWVILLFLAFGCVFISSLLITDVPASPFLDLTVLNQSSVKASFSPPLTDGGSSIHSYKVSNVPPLSFFTSSFIRFRLNGIQIRVFKKFNRLQQLYILVQMKFSPLQLLHLKFMLFKLFKLMLILSKKYNKQRFLMLIIQDISS
jgi:hypothetical protein